MYHYWLSFILIMNCLLYINIFSILIFSTSSLFFCFDCKCLFWMYCKCITYICSAYCFDINKDRGGKKTSRKNICACAHSHVSSSSSGCRTVVVWTHLRTVSQQRCYFDRWVLPLILWLRYLHIRYAFLNSYCKPDFETKWRGFQRNVTVAFN